MRTLLLLALAPLTGLALDPVEIVRRSVSHDQRNWEQTKDYTYLSRSVSNERDSAGKTTKTEQETREVFLLYGEPYRRLIEKDGKPLSPAEALKEQRKIDDLAERRARETPAEREKRLANWRKSAHRDREVAAEIPDAFDFKLLGEEVIAGRKTWVLDATPRAAYQPRNWKAGMLKKFKGRMWIDQTEYQWTRLEGEVIDTVSFGLVLARLAKGSKIFFEQTRVNDEVWMPARIRFDFDARVALFKHLLGDQTITFSNFRKFQVESRVTSTTGVE